jgi:hypothetical protein
MLIRKIEGATIIKIVKKSVENFFADFSKKYINFKNENLIIDFSDNNGEKTENILLFLQYSKKQKDNGMSFVIVVKGIDIDSIPDELVIVPTLTEAINVIEMENIERDLGF